VEKLRNNTFSVSYFEDNLIQVQKTLEIADYALILKNTSSNDRQKQEALSAVKLTDWKNINYNSVIELVDSLKLRAQETYKISDRIFAERLRINLSADSNVDVASAELKLESAINSFKNERYDEANRFVDESQKALELAISEGVKNASLRQASMNFLRRYWYYVLAFVIIFSWIFVFIYKKVKRFNIRHRIYRMRAEKQALHNLIIIAQKERFQSNKISGLVYNVRIKKYNERLNQIDEEIPVLEEKLRDKKKGKNKT